MEMAISSLALEINLQDIPQCQINSLMDALVKGMRGYYSQPEAEERFQKWYQIEENQRRVEVIKNRRASAKRIAAIAAER